MDKHDTNIYVFCEIQETENNKTITPNEISTKAMFSFRG